jgi:hypothetical protein
MAFDLNTISGVEFAELQSTVTEPETREVALYKSLRGKGISHTTAIETICFQFNVEEPKNEPG